MLKKGDELVKGSTWFVMVAFKPTKVGQKHARIMMDFSGPTLAFHREYIDFSAVAIQPKEQKAN